MAKVVERSKWERDRMLDKLEHLVDTYGPTAPGVTRLMEKLGEGPRLVLEEDEYVYKIEPLGGLTGAQIREYRPEIDGIPVVCGVALYWIRKREKTHLGRLLRLFRVIRREIQAIWRKIWR